MRIACLQFAPQVGDVDNNLNRADSVLSRANPDDLDLLVLPELAFSGYNFKSLTDISPFLEPSGAGITSLWARTTALKYNCVVAAGYPEKVDVSRNWPTSPEYYNSVIVVNEEGETIANYRKSHLYYTDETWALEGSDGFYKGYIPGVGRVALGICMDINPYRFETPWSAYEFAFHVLDVTANIVVLSMAWLTTEDARSFSRTPKEPDMETMAYWITRLEPLIRADNDDEIIVIFANRTGTEDEAVYAGTSAVIGIQHGEVSVYGLLGRGEKELLVVDTSLPPFAKMVYRPSDEPNSVRGTSDIDRAPPSTNDKTITGANSPAHSAASATSSTSGSNKSKPHNPGGGASSLGVSKDPVRRIFGGNVVITQDILSPAANNFPSTPFEESPSSPRYFWLPPENLKTPDPSLTRSSTSHSLIKRAGSSTLSYRAKSVQPTNIAPEASIPCETDHSTELIELVETLQKITRDPSSSTACPARPESPKSRNASRTGRGERSDSVRARRPPSVLGNRAQSALTEEPDKIAFRPESPKSRNASRTRSRTRTVDTPVHNADFYYGRSASKNQARLPTPLDLKTQNTNLNQDRHPVRSAMNTASEQERLQDGTPDMEKLGADLLVFEEREGRPRRDSLECHADEDDFVVFHASMRRDRQGAGKPSGETDVERPGSQKGLTSKHAGSPGLSSTKSPKEAWSSGKPQISPDLSDARAISRGRQRTTKPLESKQSPKSTEYKSSTLSSSVENWSKAQVSPPNGSFSRRYKSPEGSQGASIDSRVDKSRSRRDSSARLKVAVNGSSLPATSSKKVPRDKSQRSFENSFSTHGSSIRTTEVTSAPTTPESVPVTPKAMVLEPDWDKGSPLEVVEVDKRARQIAESHADRPKSVVW